MNDDIAPLRTDETDYTCPQCHTDTNFEDETNLLKRWKYQGFLGERDWLELWRCPVCGQKYPAEWRGIDESALAIPQIRDAS